MTMDERELVLDGNALGGMLGEVMAVDATAAVVTCGACRAVGPLAAAVVYMQAPSPVVRCRGCGSVLCVVVQRGERVRIHVDRLAVLEL
jgi:uncharacterized Zn finger protein